MSFNNSSRVAFSNNNGGSNKNNNQNSNYITCRINDIIMLPESN
jgi:hypothetical protein